MNTVLWYINKICGHLLVNILDIIVLVYYNQLSSNKKSSKRFKCVCSRNQKNRMSIDKSRIPKLSDSSKKFVPKKQRNQWEIFRWKGPGRLSEQEKKNVSGVMVDTRSQEAWEDKRAKLEVQILMNPALDENRAGRAMEIIGNWRLTSKSTPVEQSHDFVTSTETLDR